jgi:hypothetical protein
MHFVNPKFLHPIAYVDEFLKDKQNVRRLNSTEAEFTMNKPSEVTEVVVL